MLSPLCDGASVYDRSAMIAYGMTSLAWSVGRRASPSMLVREGLQFANVGLYQNLAPLRCQHLVGKCDDETLAAVDALLAHDKKRGGCRSVTSATRPAVCAAKAFFFFEVNGKNN